MGAATSLPSWAVIPFYILGESAVVLIINAAGAASDGKPSYNTGSLVRRVRVFHMAPRQSAPPPHPFTCPFVAVCVCGRVMCLRSWCRRC